MRLLMQHHCPASYQPVLEVVTIFGDTFHSYCWTVQNELGSRSANENVVSAISSIYLFSNRDWESCRSINEKSVSVSGNSCERDSHVRTHQKRILVRKKQKRARCCESVDRRE